MIDSDKIIAEEFKWVLDNEPTFNINGNKLTGKVGRSLSGESILISISIPEFYPVLKPEVKVVADITHPNIDNENLLALQLLDEWDPVYRLKDIISSARRLFIKSKRSITDNAKTRQTSHSNLEDEINKYQRKINEVNKQITEMKNKSLQKSGKNIEESITLNQTVIKRAEHKALVDLLDMLVYKFEEAEIDQTDFFRMYRKYIKQQYLVSRSLSTQEVNKNDIPTEKEKRPIRH